MADLPRLDGMGALLHDDGIGFRVWAPHASAVAVKGEFNMWSDDANPLESEGNGYWYGFVPGATVGQEYKFHLTNGDNQFDRVDPYARQVTNSVGNGVIYDHGAFDWGGVGFHCPPHNELVIYEAHIGSFFTEGGPGNFESATDKIGHLLHLGVNAVQLMPVMEFAGDYSWGYNPAHIFAVESAYGGPDALKTFIRECHKNGIAVLMDVVYNHFGPSDLDLWTFDGWSENGKGGIYFFQDWRSSTPWGDTRPDYGREEVRRFIRDNALMWLRDYRADGLRYDMTPYMRSVSGSGIDIPEGWDLMRWINTDIRSEFPGRITIAEDMHGDPRITGTEDGGAAFHAQWDGKFVHPVRKALEEMKDEWRSIQAVRDAVQIAYDGDAFRRVIYTESHDEVANGKARVVNEINPYDQQGWYAQKRSTLGAGLVMTSPGIPMIFQGQEFLQGDFFRDDVPLDWHLNDAYHGIVRLYRDLIRLRRNTWGDSRGLIGQYTNFYHVNEEAKVFAFQRWSNHGPGDDTVVVMNLSDEPRENYVIGMPSEGRWKLRFNSDSRGYSDQFSDYAAYDLDAWDEDRDGMPAHVSLRIGPYSMLIYTFEG